MRSSNFEKPSNNSKTTNPSTGLHNWPGPGGPPLLSSRVDRVSNLRVNTNFNEAGGFCMPLGLGASKNQGSMSSTKLPQKYISIENKVQKIQPNSKQAENLKFYPTAKTKKNGGNNQSVQPQSARSNALLTRQVVNQEKTEVQKQSLNSKKLKTQRMKPQNQNLNNCHLIQKKASQKKLAPTNIKNHIEQQGINRLHEPIEPNKMSDKQGAPTSYPLNCHLLPGKAGLLPKTSQTNSRGEFKITRQIDDLADLQRSKKKVKSIERDFNKYETDTSLMEQQNMKFQNLIQAVTTARTTPKYAGQKANLQQQKNHNKQNEQCLNQMTRTIDPVAKIQHGKMVKHEKHLHNIDSEHQLIIQNFNSIDDSIKKQREFSNDEHIEHVRQIKALSNDKEKSLNFQNTIQITKFPNLSIESANEADIELIEQLIHPSSQTTKNQIKVNIFLNKQPNKQMKFKLGQKNFNSRESLEGTKLHPTSKPQKQKPNEHGSTNTQGGQKRNKLIEAPFHHNKVIDQHQKSNRKLGLERSAKRTAKPTSDKKQEQRAAFIEELQQNQMHIYAQQQAMTSQENFIRFLKSQDVNNEESYTDGSLQEIKEILNKTQKILPPNQNADINPAQQSRSQNTKFSNSNQAAPSADSKTKAAGAAAAVTKGDRGKHMSLIDKNNGPNGNRRKPIESQQQEKRFSGAADNSMHQKITGLERLGKTGHASNNAVNVTNPNIIPFINNSGSIEHISNIIDEKFSDINMSQYSSNENGLCSNMSGLFGAIASQNVAKGGQIGATRQSTYDHYLNASNEDTKLNNQMLMNFGQTDFVDKGEITDLKKKIHERDECILELVKKINKIEKCVQTLQFNNNVSSNERPKTNQTYKMSLHQDHPNFYNKGSKSVETHQRSNIQTYNIQNQISNYKANNNIHQQKQTEIVQYDRDSFVTKLAHQTLFPQNENKKNDNESVNMNIPKIKMNYIQNQETIVKQLPKDSQLVQKQLSQNSSSVSPNNQVHVQKQVDSVVYSIADMNESEHQEIAQDPEKVMKAIAVHDQSKNVNVSKTSDYPKYLSRIQLIINQWNQKMANFDNKNDKIKERGTHLENDNWMLNGRKPWKPAAYDDGFTSSFSSKLQNQRNAGFLRTSQCLFNPTSSRLGRNEPGSTIEDYESSNMNAISTRLRSESPNHNNHAKHPFDQFRDIDILEPSGKSRKRISPLKKENSCTPCQPIDDLYFNEMQQTPRVGKAPDIQPDFEAQKEKKQKQNKCFNPGIKVRRKLIDQLKKETEHENDFQSMFNNLIHEDDTATDHNKQILNENNINCIQTQKISPSVNYHNFLANQPTQPTQEGPTIKIRNAVPTPKQGMTDIKPETQKLTEFLSKFHNDQLQETAQATAAAAETIVQSCTGGSQMVNFSNTSQASTINKDPKETVEKMRA